MEEKILAALAQLNGKFDTMQSDMAEMKADIAGLKTDVAGLKTDVAGLKADMAEVKAEQKSMKADIAELKTDVAGLKTDVAGLQTDVASLKKEQEGMAAQLHENHMLLTAVREAQDVQGAELDRLNMTTASRQSVERLKTTLATQLSAMSEAVVNA
ncbi:MAG: hypothetical protein MR665_01270 [Selenomonas bovis]|nr:hypothetical protein [Selenomonas bovis]